MKSLKPLIALLGCSLVQVLFLAKPLQSQELLKPISPKFAPDPQVYTGTAGGDLELQDIAGKSNGDCQGLALRNPNHSLSVQKKFGFLSLRVTGDRSLSILVKGPDGNYCRSGKSPELSGEWLAGKYQIWVGSSNGDRVNYKLTISETNQ
ncbi:MAG: hypothetical protein AUK48_00950 [Oscillatoriales cyanobacterium CG2_30_44_21]|nr:MAG: hypothetical protein AUK48_00950 [Oscillatoriales cyanobacterium CG2_30_44_21]